MKKASLQVEKLAVVSFATEPDPSDPVAGGSRYCTLIEVACGTGYTDCPCA